MLFTLKKIIGMLVMPLPFISIMIVAAALLCLFRRLRLGRSLLITAFSLLFVLSLPVTVHCIAQPLEYAHPLYRNQPVEFVIVLGGYHRSNDKIPISSLLSSVSMVRLSEGIRIYRQNPGSRLLLSGYNGADRISQAEAMALVAEAYGVPREDMILEPRAQDTDDEAMYWSAVVQDRPHALVTSAVHMPRAMALFQRHGTTPVSAPTEFMTADGFEPRWQDWVPSGWALSSVERAWHEYVGIVWGSINEP